MADRALAIKLLNDLCLECSIIFIYSVVFYEIERLILLWKRMFLKERFIFVYSTRVDKEIHG